MIAALYIDPRGPYVALVKSGEDIAAYDGASIWSDGHEHRYLVGDAWPENLGDARKYGGPHPVVAHPPCGPWGRLRHLYRGTEHDCAPRAVEQVRRWGGVLEHPAGSLLWQHCGLFGPEWFTGDGDKRVDMYGGYTIEVDQCEWGHVARKRTWLYLVGVPREALEAPPFPGREPTHYVSGRRAAAKATARVRERGWTGGAAPAGIKICSAQQRRRTPPLFAEYLVRLARATVKP